EPSIEGTEIIKILKFIRPGNGYEPNFKLTQKTEINGETAHPVYKFLKRSCPATRTSFFERKLLDYEPLNERDIRWNFVKILVEPFTGTPYRRYDFTVKPQELVKDIEHILVTMKNISPLSSNSRFQRIFSNIISNS
ncbi:glutathione peroxidase-like protein, partial [Dinothrombium tinctorium]